MDLEELILLYYLKVFSTISLIILIIFFIYFFNFLNKNIFLKNNIVEIKKGESFESVVKNNITDLSNYDLNLIKIFYFTNVYLNNNFIHHGEFYLENNISIINFLNTISKPSNVLKKITIVEGWSEKKLNKELKKYFINYNSIPYEDIIADTYFFEDNIDFNTFLNKLKKTKKRYFNKFKDSKIYKSYNEKEIIIIGSLIEKEGLDYIDKRNISSVIFNRLKKNMKLQIDASVLFAITNGSYNLNRKLYLKDLKIDHPYNTYLHKGLPPKPISYVGKKTLDIIFEDYKTEYLFYFFDYSLNMHIFSKNYDEHKRKLNDYRNKK